MTTFLRALKLSSVACALLLAPAAFESPASERGAAAPRQKQADTQRQAGQRSDARPPAHSPDAGDEDPVDTLDRVVRARFHNHIGFGMARIATERRFDPETEEERGAVRAVRRAGLKVGLFLVGRGILADVPPERRHASTRFGGMWPGGRVSGPIFLNATDAKKLPAASVYWDEARRAMLSFAAGEESYEFEAGGWKAAARPVRAAESCLKCHTADIEHKPVVVDGKTFYETGLGGNKLKVGDPLGAMLYVYKRED